MTNYARRTTHDAGRSLWLADQSCCQEALDGVALGEAARGGAGAFGDALSLGSVAAHQQYLAEREVVAD